MNTFITVLIPDTNPYLSSTNKINSSYEPLYESFYELPYYLNKEYFEDIYQTEKTETEENPLQLHWELIDNNLDENQITVREITNPKKEFTLDYWVVGSHALIFLDNKNGETQEPLSSSIIGYTESSYLKI